MNKNFQDILNKIKKIKLSSEEKDKMRADLEYFIKINPVRNLDSDRLLYQERSNFDNSTVSKNKYKSLLINILKPMPIAILAVIIISVSGGAASFAAEGSLPGDTLYPVKVGINEEVRSLVSLSGEAKADWSIRRAERRLEEAEKLAATGRLNAETSAQIESRFEAHAEAFQERAEKIESKQGTESAFAANSNFESSLRAHEQILSRLADENENTRENIDSLLSGIRTRLGVAAEARGVAEAEISGEVGVESKTAAERSMKVAESRLSEVRAFVDGASSSVNESVIIRAEARLNQAAEVIVQGKAEMEAENYGRAFISFQEAIRISQEVRALVAASIRTGLEITVPVVDIETRPGINIRPDTGVRTETRIEADAESDTSIQIESETGVESTPGGAEIEGEGSLRLDVGL